MKSEYIININEGLETIKELQKLLSKIKNKIQSWVKILIYTVSILWFLIIVLLSSIYIIWYLDTIWIKIWEWFLWIVLWVILWTTIPIGWWIIIFIVSKFISSYLIKFLMYPFRFLIEKIINYIQVLVNNIQLDIFDIQSTEQIYQKMKQIQKTLILLNKISVFFFFSQKIYTSYKK